MSFFGPFSRRLLCLIAITLTMIAVPAGAESATPSALPKVSLDLQASGFRPLSPAEQSSDESHFTVDFLDSDHLLFTFDRTGLTKRHPECPSTHRDRIVDAFVYKISSNSIERKTEWYLHDRMPYLWALAGGQVLLRRGDSLYRVDRNLEEKKVLESQAKLHWVGVAADGSQIMVETRAEREIQGANSTAKNKSPFELRFIDATTFGVVRSMQFPQRVTFDATATGYSDLLGNPSNGLWLVRYGPGEQGRNYVARVRSKCIPDLMLTSSNTLLIGRCPKGGAGYSMSAFSVSGHRLWRQKYEDRRFAPKIVRSDNGERFALSALRRPPGWQTPTSPEQAEVADGKEDDTPAWVQHIEVYEAASGHTVTTAEATPYIVGGHNVALAPDGSALAVLQGTRLAIYSLPPTSSEEKAKLLAMKADTPGLYMASSDADEALDLQAALTDPADVSARATTPVQPPPNFPQTAAPAERVPATDRNSVQSDMPTPALTIRKTTQNVIVDVVVTDPKNHPVQALKREDFTVKEDGVPQTLRSFEEHREGEKKVLPVTPPPVTANTFTNVSTAPELDSVAIILFDTLNSRLEEQAIAHKQLVDYIKKKPKAQRVAVFQLASNLRLISGFTDSEETLIAAISGRKSRLRPSPVQIDYGQDDPFVQIMQADFNNNPNPALADMMDMRRHAQAQRGNLSNDMRISFTLDAFVQLGRYLSGIPGRKNLIWLSGSFPLNVFPNLTIKNPTIDTRNYQSSVKKALDVLASAHVAVYPVSVAGVQTGMTGIESVGLSNPADNVDMAANYAGHIKDFVPTAGGKMERDNTNIHPGSINSQSSDLQLTSSRRQEDHSAMEMAAADTGGRAFTSTNDLKDAIQSAVEQGSNYYTLSYSPSNTNFDGRFRKIKVDLEAQAHRLTYRNGYYADDPDAPPRHAADLSRDLGLAAMQQGSPEARQIQFLTRITPVGKPRETTPEEIAASTQKGQKAPQNAAKMQRYAIDWAVSAKDLKFVQNPDGKRHGVFNLMITAFDDSGKLVKRFGSTVTSDLSPANFNQVVTAGYRIHNDLDIPVSAVAMRLGVQDTANSKLGTLEVKFPIPPPPDIPVRKARAMPEIEPD